MCTLEKKKGSNIYILTLTGSDEHRLNPDLIDSIQSALSTLTVSSPSILITTSHALPMPTIAAITGHASAAGMILALSHDYVVMRKDRGFLYMSEVDIGLVIPDWFVTVLNSKIGSGSMRREVVMSAMKLTAEMGVERGIVHSAHHGAQETVEGAVRLGEELLQRRWNGQVYAENRMVVYRDVVKELDEDQKNMQRSSQTVSSKL
ncbi:Enoyl-CoA delta isomerase 1, peroxisomal [Linum perenne]